MTRRRPPRSARPAGPGAVAGASLTLAALVALTPLAAPAARAAQGLQSGSWWRSQPDGAPLPAPPQVPDGGLWVASDAAGPSAVSAVGVDLEGGESAPLLRLKVHSNQSSGPPPVVACRATAPWKPATAGAWSGRPPSDCGRGKADGALSSDGTTMTFDLTALAASGALDVVLQPPPQDAAATPPPGPAPGLPSPPAPPPPGSAPVYDLTFERPTPADVTVTPAPVATPDSFAPSASSPGIAPDAGPSAFVPSSASTPSALGPTSAQPVLGSPAPQASPAAADRAPLGLRRAAAHAGRADRIAAAVTFLALALWAWRVMTAEGGRAVGRSARPRLTLYDAPELVVAAERPRQYAPGPRIGVPPALR